MARRKRQKQRSRGKTGAADSSAESTSAAEAGASSAPSPAPPAAAFKRLFAIAIVVAVTWGLFLAVLAVTTANPVTVNREQVLRADFIARLTVNDPKSGAIALDKLWDGRKPDLFTLENLKETGAEAGRSYYVPVTKTGQGRYIVTPTRLPGNPPLIYPATPEAEEQLTAILQGR